MNLIRTIQATEDPRWVALFFTQGPHKVHPGLSAPFYPFQVPFPFRLTHTQHGYLYMVYRRSVIGYGRVKQVTLRPVTMHVGTLLQPVKPGHTVTIDGAYQRLPVALLSVQVRGFTSVRYTTKDLHTLNASQLRTELDASGVIVY